MKIIRYLLVVCTAFYASLPIQAFAQQQRPNIIFILTDDHRWDALGAAGNPVIQTPNLDRLAKNGRLYKNAYVTTAICCVSRASILTGQYEARHQIKDFQTDLNANQLANSFPLLLKKNGYRIGAVGKYGVGVQKRPVAGYDYWSCSEKVQPDYLLTRADGEKIHHTDSVANDALKFLDEANANKPFFLWVGFKAPHELDGDPPQYVVQARYKTLYQNVSIKKPVSADLKYWKELPAFYHQPQNIARKRFLGLLGNDSLYQKNVKNYYRLISGVDEVVGKLRDKLKAKGLDNNTIIIFMGDNGFYLGEHGLEGKWFGHQESIRVPLIIYDPRQNAHPGQPLNSIALNIDIAPTVLRYGGVGLPAGMQGADLNGNGLVARKTFYYEHHFSKAPAIPQVEGIVGTHYKYLFYPEFSYEEFFDLQRDPFELQNRISSHQYHKLIQEYRERYRLQHTAVQ